VLERLLGPLARRYAWIATALRVQQRFSAVRGSYLASAVTLNVFLALFPLLLVGIAVVGFLTNNDTSISGRIIENLGLTGTSAQTMQDALDHAASTRKAASAIGLVGLLWSGLGVVAAIEYALDSTWQVTGRSIKDKLRGLLWCVGALVILGSSIALTTVIEIVVHGAVLGVLSILGAVVVNFAFWMWTFVVLSYHRHDWHAYVPGALLAAVGLEAVKQVATALPSLFTGASALYGSFGIALAILTTLLLFGRLVVYSSILNVVRWEEDHGTVTVDVEVPKVGGEVPLEADRSGSVQPPVPGRS